MNYRAKSALVSALLLTTLSGCVTSGDGSVTLAAIPSDLRTCFDRVVPDPGVITSRQDIVNLVARLKASEESKSRCGKRLIAWYDTQAAVYAR